jgi:hypothetical protein
MSTTSSWLRVAAVALAVGCAQVDSPNESRVLPVAYRTSFVPVRGCRPSLDHMVAIVIRTAPDVAHIYDQGPFPFPTGALVVKEQYGDMQCTNLQEYAVMKKEEGGFDPAGGDWQWYRLDSRQHVVESGKIPRCARCHAQCGLERDRACADP